MMKFTQDWFSERIPGIQNCIDQLTEKSKFLEIGCFEGLSTCWLLDQMDGGVMFSIDNFAGDGDYELNGDELYEIAKSNINETVKSNQVHNLMRTTSYKGMADLIHQGWEFDFIYVDGSHNPKDVLVDICMAWGMLKVGGVMMLDDAIKEDLRMAINSFYRIFNDKCDVIHNEYSVEVEIEFVHRLVLPDWKQLTITDMTLMEFELRGVEFSEEYMELILNGN